jgi:hypothetical protein
MEEKKELQPGRTRLRDIPWKPIITGLGTIGAGTLAGYLLGGLTAHGVMNSQALANYVGTDPRKLETVRKGVALGSSALGSLAGLSGYLLHLAHQQHLYEAYQQKDKEKQQMLENPKVAHVIDIYRMALERMR